MAARKRELATVSAAPQLDQRYESLVNGIAGVLTPVIQEGFRRAMVAGVGGALANSGQVANGALLAQAAQTQALGPRAETLPGDGSKCREPGCNNPVRCKGLCSKHYQVARRKAVKRKAARKPARSKRTFDKRMDAPRRGPSPARKAKATAKRAIAKSTTTSRKAPPRVARPGKTVAKPTAPESKAAA